MKLTFDRLIGTLSLGMLCCAAMVMPMAAAASPSLLVYIGTYTGAKSKGIYFARFDSTTGKLSQPELAAETKSPSFLAVHPKGRFLYAVGEIDEFEGKKSGAVLAFSMDEKTGKLALLNQQASGGGGPCHLAIDASGKCVLVANYGGGSVAALPIGADGRLGKASSFIQHTGSSINPSRQAGPHGHFIAPDLNNRFALTCDLGLDKVLVYRLDPERGLLDGRDLPPGTVKPGSGPRHLAFHPTGRYVYVINEMLSTLTAFAYADKTGALEELQTLSTLPAAIETRNSCAEIQMHPSGKFVYGSNRGHDSIAVFGIDAQNGQLKLIEHQATQGKTPRHFAIDPAGKWLLAENQGSDTIVVFSIDQSSGKLTPTGQVIEVGSPVCLVFATASF